MAKGIYVGVNTEVPIYEEKVGTTVVDADNITSYFQVTNNQYYFKGAGTIFTTTNKGVHSTTAQTVLTALQDITDLSFTYSYSSESKYDKFTLIVGGTTVANALSGSTTTNTYTGTLTKGQSITFKYEKDGSQNKNNDECTFSNMNITCVMKTQTGTEVKSIARAVHKGYVGVDGKARKIKKVYIGVNGIAKCVLNNAGKFSFYKKATALSKGRNRLAAGSNSKYILIAGGYGGGAGNDGHQSVVDAYDTSFTRKSATALKNAREQLSPATIGDRVLFAGGEGYGGEGASGDTIYVDTYDASLTKTMAPNLSDEAQFIHSGTIGNYALFGTNATVADAYNASLTKTTTTGLSNYRDTGASAIAGEGKYLVFAGGTTDKDATSAVTAVVDAYDASLTRTVPEPLSIARSRHGGASVGGRALFGGGYDPNASNKSTASVEAYDGSLTRTTLTSPLSVARRGLRGGAVPGFAIFAMGYDGSDLNTVDVYDDSLTRTVAQGTATAGDDPATASFYNYVVVAGGAGDARISDVNVYQVTYDN